MDNASIVPSNNKITPTADNNPSIDNQLQQKQEVVERIPIYEEDFSITKEITKTQLHLEKKWINSTKKIEIPIKYEEMFINGREFDSYSKNELVEVFSKIKERISEAIHSDQNEKDEKSINNSNENKDSKKQYPHDIEVIHIKNEEKSRENKTQSAVDLDNIKTLPQQNTNEKVDKNQIQVSNDRGTTEGEQDEQIISLWGEQIIIDKKMVKLGEIVIKKSKVSENTKFDVDIRSEKVTVEYPDGNKEEFGSNFDKNI